MWAFEVLGLPEGAGEREIKRAYARLLKLNRPDENPDGFQELHQAYQVALSISRFSDDSDQSEEPQGGESFTPVAAPWVEPGAEPEPVVEQSPVLIQTFVAEPLPLADRVESDLPYQTIELESGLDEHSSFDQEAFLEECITQGLVSTPEDFLAWLERRPEFLFLGSKSELGHALLCKLSQEKPPIHPDVFDVLLQFLDLNLVQGYLDSMWLMHLEQRIVRAWELQPENWPRLRIRLRMSLPAEQMMNFPEVMQQLCRPFRYLQAIRSMLTLRRPSEIRNVLLHLDEGEVNDLPPPVNPEQVSFWMKAGDQVRVSWPRLQVGIWRLLAILFACAALILPIGGLDVFYRTVMVVGGAFGVWVLYILVQASVVWQRRREDEPAFCPWLRLLWVPLWCLCGIFLYFLLLPDVPWWGYGVSLFATVTAVFRYFGRNRFTGLFSGDMNFFWAMVGIGIGLKLSFYIIPVVGMGVWLMDVWNQRSGIRECFEAQRIESDGV